MTKRKPIWLQCLAVPLLLLLCCGISFAYAAGRIPQVSALGVWSTVLAGPFTWGFVMALWRRPSPSKLAVAGVGMAIFGLAGVLAGGYALDPVVADVPIMKLMPLLYPASGAAWGLLVDQAIEQGYVPFVGTEN